MVVNDGATRRASDVSEGRLYRTTGRVFLMIWAVLLLITIGADLSGKSVHWFGELGVSFLVMPVGSLILIEAGNAMLKEPK